MARSNSWADKRSIARQTAVVARPLLYLLTALTASNVFPAQSTACGSLSAEKRDALLAYVAQKYKLPPSVALTVSADESLQDTCFRKLTFEGRSSLNTWKLQLFLSPDGRYLTSDLLDTKLDPVVEEQRKMQLLMDSLAANKGASLGPENAPVTIVEFSDLQCPYCRALSSLLDDVLPSVPGKVRVVFHHMPLGMHAWARTAAEGAACAQFQGEAPFWAFQRQVFERQGQITAENVKPELTDIARKIPDLDSHKFQACLDNEMSLGLVLRDIDLASANGVNATPTLFINGHRVQGVKNAKELRELIDAAAEDQSTKANSAAVNKPLGSNAIAPASK